MEWLILIGVIFLGAIIWGVVSGTKQAKAQNLQAETYSAAITEEKTKMLKGEGQASLPVLDAGSEGYRPVGGEKLLAVQPGATRMEMKSTGRYKTGGGSVSIPIMKGVRYRVGSGSIRTEKAGRLRTRAASSSRTKPLFSRAARAMSGSPGIRSPISSFCEMASASQSEVGRREPTRLIHPIPNSLRWWN